MTLPADRKIKLLLDFHKKLREPGWTFTESGPDESDRQLLVEFDKVIYEFGLLDAKYQTVIADITARMGAGMASYIEASTKSPLTVNTFSEWDVYCHFVAGIVGEGVSRLFSESNIEREWIGDQLELSNHMGLFLQKVNIIRDYAEDSAEDRFFWPKEAYAKFGFERQPDVAKGIVPVSPGSKWYKSEGEDGKRAMGVLSTVLLDAMRHSTRSLDYLSLLREQSIFNFCAIPQTMAIATIELMVNNPNVFRRNVKIRKSQAVQMILRSVNPRDVAFLFAEQANRIAKKIPIDDPNYTQWKIELGKVHVWCEHHYPSFVSAGPGDNAAGNADVRGEAMKRWAADRQFLASERAAILEDGGDPGNLLVKASERRIHSANELPSGAPAPAIDPRRKYMTEMDIAAQDKKDRDEMIKFFVIIIAGLSLFMGLTAFLAWYVAWYLTTSETDPLTLFVGRNWQSGKVAAHYIYREVSRDPVGFGKQQVQWARSKFDL